MRALTTVWFPEPAFDYFRSQRRHLNSSLSKHLSLAYWGFYGPLLTSTYSSHTFNCWPPLLVNIYRILKTCKIKEWVFSHYPLLLTRLCPSVSPRYTPSPSTITVVEGKMAYHTELFIILKTSLLSNAGLVLPEILKDFYHPAV